LLFDGNEGESCVVYIGHEQIQTQGKFFKNSFVHCVVKIKN